MVILVKVMFLIYDNHPSIISIKQHITEKNKVFSFRKVTKEEISSGVKTLNRKTVSYFLSNNFNRCLKTGIFPDELKLAVVPVFKMNDKKVKNNYRPISILSNISKIYERCMYN